MARLQRSSWKLAVLLGSIAGSITFLSIAQASDTQSCLRREGQSPSLIDAVRDTLDPQDCERWPHLTPIRQDNPNLIWQDDQVLMVTWSQSCNEATHPNALACMSEGQTYVVPSGSSYSLWVTAAPEVRAFMIRESYYNPSFGRENITSRLEQYLGLRPNEPERPERIFVEMWVSPADIIRPCLDENPSDVQCELWSVDDIDQGSKFENAFGSGELDDRYPFTGFGYTYDWGNPNTDVGASEFVIHDGASVTLHRKMRTQDYVQGVMTNP